MRVTNRIGVNKAIFIFFLPVILSLWNPSLLPAQQHGDLVRVQGEEKIYLIQSGQRRAIASEEVFRQMGFRKEDVKELDSQTLMSIPEGPPLWSKEIIAPYPDGTLIRLKGKAHAYVIRGGRKCYIPDPETFQANGFQWDQVIEVDQSVFNKIPTGIPLASVKPPTVYGAPGTPLPPSGPPGMPPPPYPSQPYPPSPSPPQAPSPSPYPPSPYPPSTAPPPYPPPPGQQPSPYPPSAPPPYPPSPSYPPSSSPPSKPSSYLPGGSLSIVGKSYILLTLADSLRTIEMTPIHA